METNQPRFALDLGSVRSSQKKAEKPDPLRSDSHKNPGSRARRAAVERRRAAVVGRPEP